MDLDWNDLKFIRALAQGGSVAAAARALAVDNSTVSAARRAAEAGRASKIAFHSSKLDTSTSIMAAAGEAAFGEMRAGEIEALQVVDQFQALAARRRVLPVVTRGVALDELRRFAVEVSSQPASIAEASARAARRLSAAAALGSTPRRGRARPALAAVVRRAAATIAPIPNRIS